MTADFGPSHTRCRFIEGACLGILFLSMEESQKLAPVAVGQVRVSAEIEEDPVGREIGKARC
jgi:hypothetical protein